MKANIARSLVVWATMALVGFVALQGCQSQPAQPAAQSKPTTGPAAAQAAPTAAAPQAPAAAATQAPAPTAAPETVKLGLMVSLTGPTAHMGAADERYIKFGIEDVNAKGGFKVGGKTYKFTSVTVDDKSIAEGGREAANRLVLDEKVKVILGPVSTPLAAAQAITEPSKVLVMPYTALDKSLGKQFPLTIQIGSTLPVMRLGALYDLLKKDHPNVKRVTFMYPDDPTGHSTADAAAKVAQERGFTVASQEFYPMEIKDFSPLVTRVLRTNPDAIDVGPSGGRGPLFLAQAKALSDQGFKGPTFGVSADLAALSKGAAFMEGFRAVLLADHNSPAVLDVDKQIVQRYIKAYSEADLETVPIPNYSGPMVLAQIMEKAGTVTDTEKMAQVLRDGEWTTMYGKQRLVGVKTYGMGVIFEAPIYFSGIRDGKVGTYQYLNGTLP